MARGTAPRVARTAPTRRSRAPKPDSAPAFSAVKVTQVAIPSVWAEALRLAKGDAKRITVISPARVEVDTNF